MKFKKGDTIKIIAGKDKGKTGKIVKIYKAENKILAEGLNIFKKHVRPKKQGEKGEVVQIARPFNASNAMLVCSSCKKATRVGYRISEGKKDRYCKKCKGII